MNAHHTVRTQTCTQTHTPVSRGLKKPWRTRLSGNWTLRTTWRHTVAAGYSKSAYVIRTRTFKKQDRDYLSLVLTLGYLSIFSFIWASFRDLVISGASSNDFLEEWERKRGDGRMRNKKQTVGVNKGKDEQKMFHPLPWLVCGRACVRARQRPETNCCGWLNSTLGNCSHWHGSSVAMRQPAKSM